MHETVVYHWYLSRRTKKKRQPLPRDIRKKQQIEEGPWKGKEEGKKAEAPSEHTPCSDDKVNEMRKKIMVENMA
jgi:hypothetical protein